MRLGRGDTGENEVLKKWVLSLVGKDEKVGELRIWLGKQFQKVVAEIEKELLVKRRSVRGTL